MVSYGAHLHDWSEEQWSICRNDRKRRNIRIAKTLLNSEVDALAIEKISCYFEPRALLDQLIIQYPRVKG